MEFLSERERIIETCHLMCSMNYFIGTWGNVSMRVGDKILLTPSRVNYDLMKPEDIVVIDLEGNKVSGDRNPTSEKEVHRQIYLIRDDVNAIIHAHTEKAMAVSCARIQEVPCIVEEMSQLLGGAIPLAAEYVPAAQHFELGKAAAAAIGDKNGVILRNHGPVSCGKDMDEAILSAQVIEKACHIFLDEQATGIAMRTIPQNFVDSEHYRYKYTYGKEKT